MGFFTVTREAGSGWTGRQGIGGQQAMSEHAAFMDALADEGFVLFGGPLAGSEQGRLRALLIVSADSEDEIHGRLADDPWTRTQRLRTVSVETWSVFIGADRLPPVRGPRSERVE
jgi:uncharacterized protein YciI